MCPVFKVQQVKVRTSTVLLAQVLKLPLLCYILTSLCNRKRFFFSECLRKYNPEENVVS